MDLNPELAEQYYTRGCQMGSSAGCERVASLGADELQSDPAVHLDPAEPTDSDGHEHGEAVIWGSSMASSWLQWERGGGFLVPTQ